MRSATNVEIAAEQPVPKIRSRKALHCYITMLRWDSWQTKRGLLCMAQFFRNRHQNCMLANRWTLSLSSSPRILLDIHGFLRLPELISRLRELVIGQLVGRDHHRFSSVPSLVSGSSDLQREGDGNVDKGVASFGVELPSFGVVSASFEIVFASFLIATARNLPSSLVFPQKKGFCALAA